MSQKPVITDTRIAAKSKLFTVQEFDLTFSNGEQRTFERLLGRQSASVTIIPFLDPDTILFIREYAAGIEKYVLTFPKGFIETDEDVLVACNRELQEEIGYGSNALDLRATLATAPGYSTGQMHFVVAQDLYPSKLPGDEPEPLEVVPWKVADLPALVQRADFGDAKNFAALYLIRDLITDRSGD